MRADDQEYVQSDVKRISSAENTVIIPAVASSSSCIRWPLETLSGAAPMLHSCTPCVYVRVIHCI